eukprot:XP_001689630.1 predicted protein [Chlamydomonas reinhardtii]
MGPARPARPRGRSWDELAAPAVWWLLHALGLWACLTLPTDLRLGTQSQLSAQHWLVAVVLGLNVVLFYTVRRSDPGYLLPQPQLLACEAAPLLAAKAARAAAAAATPNAVAAAGSLLDSKAALVCGLGAHYALTACGRGGPGGHTWAYVALLLLGGTLILLCCLVATHTFLVITGQSGRQALRRVRSAGLWGGSGAGGGAGVAGSLLGGAVVSDVAVRAAGGGRGRAGPGMSIGQALLRGGEGDDGLSLGLMLQNGVWLCCGVRPGWLVRSGGVQRAGRLLFRLVNNDVYSCC